MTIRAFVIGSVLVAAMAPAGFAQTGWIEGTVTDGEKVIGAGIKCSNDKGSFDTGCYGSFSLRVPSGRQLLVAYGMGFRSAQKIVTVGDGDTTRVSFVLQPEFWGDYPESTLVSRSHGIEFLLRYQLVQQGDSVVVTVTAEGRNFRDRPVAEAYCFSFPEMRYTRAPDHLNCVRVGPGPVPPDTVLFPVLEMPPVECKPAKVGEVPPQGTFASAMMFSFYPNAFREWPGELHLTGRFEMLTREDQQEEIDVGGNARPWEGAWSFDIGTIKIPIRPIGMPIDFTCPPWMTR